ncbi:hypothetical protein BOO35_19870 [Vibrio navarrensis]|uniref:hypothetical protein n=1 Tax=Vibrio navarrensis TaxID=29495 RepID=UPI0018675664|nr:hypothetical protein [Vibrio navarrensis]MBE3667296.1 hypothetical protein [Vibrio navarrensis]
MDNLFESVWFNFGVSLLIALSVGFAIEVFLKKVLKPKGLWWVFIPGQDHEHFLYNARLNLT